MSGPYRCQQPTQPPSGSSPGHQQQQQQPPPSIASGMAIQRFCLRWNNHQSNLLSVFDQLLHDESFVDVTLAVDGHMLKAHKLVLSACSPYFQSLFVNHPDKHPIVILKDVPYCDMKSLLDFMYRGEVSVDQDRLTPFLRVAETLRIKGLTEVNEEKCDNIANSLSQQGVPGLNRLQPNKRFAGNFNMLGNYLLQPKRKRGRPRRLSGNSNGPDDSDNKDAVVHGSPEMLEVKMGMDGFSGNNSDGSGREGDDESKTKDDDEPVAGTSKEGHRKHNDERNSDEHYPETEENNQNHTNLPCSITMEIEVFPQKQESVIISTAAARNMIMEKMEIEEEKVEIKCEAIEIKTEAEDFEPEPSAGVHFLTDEDNSENYEKKKSELLEYLIREDGTVVCKLCGEVLASRTHWYRHKYKLHVNNFINPTPLFKCNHCNVFFKSRKGYTGHLASRHPENREEQEEKSEETTTVDKYSNVLKKRNENRRADWEEQRVKEEKLVADIIDRVRRECEAQGGGGSRRGYSRRTTSVMNINTAC